MSQGGHYAKGPGSSRRLIPGGGAFSVFLREAELGEITMLLSVLLQLSPADNSVDRRGSYM